MKPNITPIAIALIGISGTTFQETLLAQESATQTYVFSAGWRTNGAKQENILQLGTVYQCATGWCMQYEEFRGSKNLQRTELAPQHEMQATTHAQKCTDNHLTIINGDKSKEIQATVKSTENELIISAGTLVYEWKKDEIDPTGYIINSPISQNPSNTRTDQSVGFLYSSNDSRGLSFDRKYFNYQFSGNIAHKDMLTNAGADWKLSNTSLDIRRFIDSTSGTSVLSFTQAGLPEVLKRLKNPVQVQHSILPAQNPQDRLRIFLHEYGHDFNGNGCFDDYGHNKMMLPVVQGNSITGFVFAEYTPDNMDGTPMLSIGRYYRKPKQ